jgi:hypothetical protein
MPVVMGETGAFRATYSTAQDAASALVAWQVDSCHQFAGWLMWLEADSDVEVWGGGEAGGAIDTALSPRERPDPCSGGAFVRQDLALHAAVRASNETADNPANLAVDGSPGTAWIAGGGPPQWIEIDLGAATDVGSIELLVAQTPNGQTRHRVLVGTSRVGLNQVAVLRDNTSDGQLLTAQLTTADGTAVRLIRIETTESPSWVGWREVSVFGR